MDNINTQIIKYKEEIIGVINKSGMPIVITEMIVKDILEEIRRNCIETLQNEQKAEEAKNKEENKEE